ncbi:MAG: glutamyl-tRNA reductase [Candidatus Hydrogenedentota bacterium]|nr:MAG: glutamyl-tRNA reductase [Candidatus Hydrogenedentota bacterium]
MTISSHPQENRGTKGNVGTTFFDGRTERWETECDRFLCLAFTHEYCSVEEIETIRKSFPEPEQLAATLPVEELLVLETCNRQEIYVVASDPARLVRALRERIGVVLPEAKGRLFTGRFAVRHLFRVAAGVASLVVGENQILGQVERALMRARKEGRAEKFLSTVCFAALRAGRRIRRETGIGRGNVSMATIALRLARRIYDSLAGKNVLLIGVGEMGRILARYFHEEGSRIAVNYHRNRTRAEEIAAEFRAELVSPENLWTSLRKADIAAVATGASEFVLTAERLAPVTELRRHRPLLILDLALPRNVEPDVGELEGVYLFGIDDLRDLAREHFRRREAEKEVAERILEEEIERWELREIRRRYAPILREVFTRETSDPGGLFERTAWRRFATRVLSHTKVADGVGYRWALETLKATTRSLRGREAARAGGGAAD